ncbi:DUF1403 family protein [Mesorhizobium sp. M0909]|uniref:DUF1403 family protein n=1 Tax=Mesorhizobium sp. M0909 TaxID=2957024 RepID=UPI00333794DD
MPTTILHPKPFPRHAVQPPGAAAAAPTVAVPSWLRKASRRRKPLRMLPWPPARQARQARRVEDEAALRDSLLLTRPGGDIGPAGLLLVGWRRLAARPAEELLTTKSLAAVLEEFGRVRDGAAVSDLADALRRLAPTDGAVGPLTGAYAAVEGHGLPRAMGPWLADALLAQKLGWQHAVPLLGTEAFLGMSARPRRSATSSPVTGIETETKRAKALLAAQARAALRAIDLSVELERRADRLLAIAPKLRAKGADAIVEQLLSDDALVASRGDKKAAMSDRGLRRLFAVRPHDVPHLRALGDVGGGAEREEQGKKRRRSATRRSFK